MPYLTATRLCGDRDALNAATWQPLRDLEPHQHDPATCRALLKWADDELAKNPTGMWRNLRVLRARAFVLGKQLPDFLEQHAAAIFAGSPGWSLWLISVDDLLVRRLAFLRAQLAFTLTPDIPVGSPDFAGFRLLSAHSLTQTFDFGAAFGLPMLVFSPGAVGIPLTWHPHALVFLFGQTADLRSPEFDGPSYVYRPRAFGRPEPWSDPPFWRNLTPADVEPLIPWWVERLNILYSHAADPTQFHDRGRHDVGAQAAWFLTLERMLVDATLLLAEPTAADISRMQLAFDILDKSEGLLGYDERSSPGFKDLLRRSKTLPRLRQAWTGLPDQLQQRFRHHSTEVFDSLYEDIRSRALSNRRTANGMLVAEPADPAKPRPVSNDDYVARLLREIRNSAHGLKRILREDERFLLATHPGDVPVHQLADLASLIAFALVADADKLCAGSWW